MHTARKQTVRRAESGERAARQDGPVKDNQIAIQAPQPLSERGRNRSRRPDSEAFRSFLAKHWRARPADHTSPDGGALHAALRRLMLSRQLDSKRLVIPAGTLKVRAGDCDYRFRAHSAFAHLTGLGARCEPDSVLILEPVGRGQGDNGGHHRATLYVRPPSGQGNADYYSDEIFGEFWVGERPSMAAVQTSCGIPTADIAEFERAVWKLAREGQEHKVQICSVRGLDPWVDALVDASRRGTEDSESAHKETFWEEFDDSLSEALSELRLVKDAWEIEQIRDAVAITVEGFHDVVKALPKAVAHPRGERVVETTFAGRAREDGNDVGYETVAASGNNATTLHWMNNDGPVRAGDLLLLDAGAETNSLYTADISRTLPVNGRFSDVQRLVYEAVLEAADAAFSAASPGRRFRDIHDAAMEVLATRLETWGILPVSARDALAPTGQHHRRWMPHGTSHHLGLDVHDCAQARSQLYLDGILVPGMVFTIEPGLYFKDEDAAVPPEFRGIGVRIEDNVLITDAGPVNLSAALPRHPDDIEAWMQSVQSTTTHTASGRQAVTAPVGAQPATTENCSKADDG